MAKRAEIDLRRRWRQEKTAAYLTRAAAAAESDPAIRRLFERLAAESEEQARLIEEAAGLRGGFSPGPRAVTVKALTRFFGPKAMRGPLAAAKMRGLSVYAGKFVAGHITPTSVNEVGARHRSAKSGSLRAAVFGVSDGLVSNASLVMGMAGASASNDIVFLTGVAGLLAGAFSMAAGEYVSVRTQREMFEHQIAQEKEELRLYPDAEAEELALIYEARGLPIDEARALAKRLVADPKIALDVLAREELGLNPDDLGSGLVAAASSFLAFAAGALAPLIPFILDLPSPVLAAAIIAGASLFAVGATMSLFSGRGALSGGLRMLAIGAAAGASTFAIGAAVDVALR